jgi:hypothetical protein
MGFGLIRMSLKMSHLQYYRRVFAIWWNFATAISADTLRTFPATRRETAAKANAILATMSGYVFKRFENK